MRLIDCRKMLLEEFVGEDIPPYAILSHTWGKDEVAYRDFGAIKVRGRAGWHKIKQTCKTALAEGIQYAWVDTCCIDKSSSAELTEAINSMFQWYARSKVCYAFLEDCDGELDEKRLSTSRWISRGWTLQELIAPRSVIFFNRHWDHVGNRSDLNDTLCNITGIPKNIFNPELLSISESLQEIPICQRMSWAAGRKTTRVEDIAYCLMGLFGVHMPLLYGEGHKAFIRLQEEIMRRNNDMSIFAWEEPTTSDYGESIMEPIMRKKITGLLAPSPNAFAASNFESPLPSTFGQEFSLTNRGIRMSAGNIRADGKSDEFILCLSHALLYSVSESHRKLLGVAIRPIGGGLFVRSRPELLFEKRPRRDRSISPTADLYLVTEMTSQVGYAHDLVNHKTICVPQLEEVGLRCTDVFPQLQYQHDSNRFITKGFDPAVGYATYKRLLTGNKEAKRHVDNLVIFFGLDNDRSPWCRVSSLDHYPGWSNERGAQEDNLKRYSSVAFRERGLDWEVVISRPFNESRGSAIVIRGEFDRDVDRGWDLKVMFGEEVRW